MSAPKHTPGPWLGRRECEWSVDTDGENSFEFIGPVDGDPVAAAIVPAAFGMDDELDANVALIAAAPEMLATLRQLAEMTEDYSPLTGNAIPTPASKLARAAIAKATGGDA